jgi:hypothetical protein
LGGGDFDPELQIQTGKTKMNERHRFELIVSNVIERNKK